MNTWTTFVTITFNLNDRDRYLMYLDQFMGKYQINMNEGVEIEFEKEYHMTSDDVFNFIETEMIDIKG